MLARAGWPSDRAIDGIRSGPRSVAVRGSRTHVRELSGGALLVVHGNTDANRFAEVWERSGASGISIAAGDHAGLVIEPSGAIIGFRSVQSPYPLLYCCRPHSIAVASTTDALRSFDGDQIGPDFEQLAFWAAGNVPNERATPFTGLMRVPQGCTLRLHPTGEVEELWQWVPPRGAPAALRSAAEAGAALRSALEAAVEERAAGLDETAPIATQLSGGRDSAAVSATLALINRGTQPLLAVTAAPSREFQDLNTAGSADDESDLAGLVAKAHPALTHLVIRPTPPADLDRFAMLSRLHHRPLIAISQFPWFDTLMRQAQLAGAIAMFCGNMGNFTISRGGHFFLADVASHHGWGEALQLARVFAKGDVGRWRSLLHAALGPYLPLPLYRGLLRAHGDWTPVRVMAPLLRSPWRKQAEDRLNALYADSRPQRSASTYADSQFQRNDPGELMHLAAYGMPVLDPTGDSRVAEVVAAVDPKLFFPSATSDRPLYAAAFGDRVPGAIVENRRRGRQSGDWFLHFPRELVQERWRLLFCNPIVNELFDTAVVEDHLERWPTRDWSTSETEDTFRHQMLVGLAVAIWIEAHFPR